jgi:hypothetical protein
MKYSEVEKMNDTELFTKALDLAGYIDLKPTEESMIECFGDYVDAGIWSNITMDYETGIAHLDNDNEPLTTRQMAWNLIRVCEPRKGISQ